MQSKVCQPNPSSVLPVAKLTFMLGTACRAVRNLAVGELAPQGLVKEEADISPEGALAALTDEIGPRWCAIGA